MSDRITEIKFDSSLFDSCRETLDAAIKTSLDTMYRKELDGATITLKISIDTEKSETRTDPETGEIIWKKIPNFKSDVSISMKQGMKLPVPIFAKGYLDYDRGSDTWIVYNDDPQMSIEDYDEVSE